MDLLTGVNTDLLARARVRSCVQFMIPVIDVKAVGGPTEIVENKYVVFGGERFDDLDATCYLAVASKSECTLVSGKATPPSLATTLFQKIKVKNRVGVVVQIVKYDDQRGVTLVYANGREATEVSLSSSQLSVTPSMRATELTKQEGKDAADAAKDWEYTRKGFAAASKNK